MKIEIVRYAGEEKLTAERWIVNVASDYDHIELRLATYQTGTRSTRRHKMQWVLRYTAAPTYSQEYQTVTSWVHDPNVLLPQDLRDEVLEELMRRVRFKEVTR